MLGRIAQPGTLAQKFLIQPVSQLRRGGLRKAGAAALAAVAVKGELADHQHLTLYRIQPQVHFSVFVLKNPKTQGLFRQNPGTFLRILRADSQQNQKAGADFSGDLPVNGDGGVFDSR